MSDRPSLVALLKPDIALAIPVNQRASCLALAHEQRIATEMWDTSFNFLGGASFGTNLPRIHPLEVITAIADCVSRSDNRYLVGRTIDNEIAAQIEWIYAKGELVILRQQTIRHGSIDHLRNIMQLCSRVRRCRFRGLGL